MKWFLRISSFLNILLVVLTISGYLGSYADPIRLSYLQVVGLFMPWLLLANVFFVVFWATMRKKWFWLSFLTLAVGFFQISRFVGFHFDQKEDKEALLVGTFNCESYNQSDNLRDFLQNFQGKEEMDILCLQEISPNQVSVLSKGIGLPYQYYFKGKIIASRYPIVSKGNIQFDKSVNGCLWVDLSIAEEKIIRVYNVHLRSNGVSHAAEGLIDEINVDRRAALSKFGGMLSNYQKASKQRKKQIAEISKHLLECPKPILLMGDLNDTPFSYTYQQLGRLLNDQFKTKGLGVGITYAGELPGLKIDYIFADDKFESLSHQIIRTKISDHFPVISRMKLIQ